MKIKEPFVIILVGPPLSGKSTFVKKNYPSTEVISRDDIVMDVYGSKNYTEAFKNVNQKDVDRVLHAKFLDIVNNKRNVIIDMTNLSPRTRARNLNYFSKDYYKVAVVFPILPDLEYQRRNKKRVEEENKDIPMAIINNMMSSYEIPTKPEGFDEIINL